MTNYDKISIQAANIIIVLVALFLIGGAIYKVANFTMDDNGLSVVSALLLFWCVVYWIAEIFDTRRLKKLTEQKTDDE